MISLKSLFNRRIPRSRRSLRYATWAGPRRTTECLEIRSLLAGNVLAAVSGGNLILTGDAADNAVDVIVVDGDLVVRGREGTTVNGVDSPFLAVSGSTAITDNLFARLGSGEDVLFVEGVSIGGNAKIDAGHGNDSVGFADVMVGRDFSAMTGRGDDVVNLDSVTIGRNMIVRTGRQSDTVNAANTTVGGRVVIDGGIHDDYVIFDTVNVAQSVKIEAGAGHDSAVITDSSIGGRLWAAMRSGSDFIQIDSTTITGPTVIRTHRGSDTVLVQGTSQLQKLVVNTARAFDTTVVASTATVTGRTKIRGANSSVVNETDRETRLNDPDIGALTRSQAATDFFRALSTVLDPLTLAVDVSGNAALESSDTLLTNDPEFRLTVATQPGATVAVDSDDDGQFDDGTAIADAAGTAILDVMLVHDDQNNGANTLTVQASNGVDTPLTEQVAVHLAIGTVVRFDSSVGTWDVEMLDADAPNTVGAFLDDLSRYDNSFVHRNVSDFIIQGGGFIADGTSTIQNVESFPIPPNEFDAVSPPNSNLRGTLSTAQNSNINSFSGQWFFNTIDNDATSPINNLDAVPHTVFGRVVGSGMTVVDTINNTPDFNITGVVSGSGSGALTDVPLLNYTTGTVPALNSYIRFNNLTAILTPPGTENTFRLLENSPVDTVVGSVTTAVAAPVIFEVNDTTLADELKLNADDHLEGAATAPVVLIEYLSLQCPSCAAAHPQVEQLLTDNPSELLVVRRHLPLDTSTGGPFEHSFEAALAAEAAGRQGMFDEMVDELFARQGDWNNSVTAAQAQAVFEDIAVNTLGLDQAQFNSDSNDSALADRINRDIADAGSLGVTSTPTWFLNGVQTSGTPSNADIVSAAQAVDRTFALNRRTGQLTVVDNNDLDFETNPVFTFDISAANGTTEIIPVTINLIDAVNG